MFEVYIVRLLSTESLRQSIIEFKFNNPITVTYSMISYNQNLLFSINEIPVFCSSILCAMQRTFKLRISRTIN